MSELAVSADPNTSVLGCPEWTVKDLLAHVTGVIADILDGRLEGVATDPWTAAQVDARRGRTIDDLLAEWNEKAPTVEAMADDFGPPGRQLVLDAVTHEHDLRGALHAPGAEDTSAVVVGSDFIVPGYLAAVAERGLGPLEISTPDGGRWTSSDGDPTARLHGTRYELMRALTGRRSTEQVRAMRWDGDATPYIDALTYGPFRPALQPLAI